MSDANESPALPPQRRERVLGIPFFTGSVDAALDEITRGGYVVIPASPALLKLKFDDDYRRALQQADLVLADSRLLARVWQSMKRRPLPTTSGQTYLRALLGREELAVGDSSFWVAESEAARTKASAWLRAHGMSIAPDAMHVASSEGDDRHAILLEIEQRRPRHVVIALSAGKQEPLALYLREYLLYRPSIHCVGSALGFVTGAERPIPEWAERWSLAWLVRLRSQPRMLLPRLGIALSVVAMVLRHGSELPPVRRRWEDL
jgi:UDP-N-acetyl-D-mannosaminuronic acid transferase (WecB/TagA/CpsF family)